MITEWKSRSVSPLDLLLPEAARALALADAQLRAAFDLSPRNMSQERSGRLSKGLAYWLFETTLAYEIFKRWLPVADVDWEVGYPHDASKKADLVVFEELEAKVVVECKWWMTSGANGERALIDDVVKLRTWPGRGDIRRLLLTFWHSAEADQQREWDQVAALCEQHGLSAVWTARFPIHHFVSASRTFSMAAILV